MNNAPTQPVVPAPAPAAAPPAGPPPVMTPQPPQIVNPPGGAGRLPPPNMPAQQSPGQPQPQMPTFQPQGGPRPIDVGIANMEVTGRQATRDELAAAKDVTKGIEKEKQGADLVNHADLEDAQANKETQQKLLDQTTDYQTKVADAQQAAQKAQADQLNKIQQLQSQYASDPKLQGSFWSNQSVGAKIGWAIALGLGGFGSGLTHTQNGAMALLDSSIQEDSAAKQRQMAMWKDRIGEARNSLMDLRQAGLDGQAALLANHNIGLEIAKQKLQAQMSMTNDQRVVGNGQRLMGQLDQKIGKNYQDIVKLTGQQTMQQAQAEAGLMAQKEHLDTQQGIAQFNAVMKQKAADSGAIWRNTVPGFQPAQNKQSFDQLAKYTSEYNMIHKPISDLQNILAPTDAGGKSYPVSQWSQMNQEAVRSVKQSQAELRVAVSRAMQMGDSFGPEQQKLVDGLLGGGDLTKLATPETSAKLLRNLDDFFKNRAYSFAKSSGQMLDSKADPLNPEWLEKNFDPNQYFANTPRQQKPLTGAGR